MLIITIVLMGLTITTFAMGYYPSTAFAVEWTPLISAADFVGIRSDLLTTAGGIISLLLIIAGLALLYKVFT